MTDTKEKIISDLIYVLKTIGLSEDGISELQETLGINRFEIIETMSDEDIKELPNSTLNIKFGDSFLLIRLKHWIFNYKKEIGGGNLPVNWNNEFSEEQFFNFEYIPTNYSKYSIEPDSIKSKYNIQEEDEDDKEHEHHDSDFRIKLTNFPDFDGSQQSWYNFRESFEALAEAAGLEELLNIKLDDQNHLETRTNDTNYDNKVRRLFKVLKKATAKGSARGKVKKYQNQQDGVYAYAYLREYYDQDGDSKIYGNACLQNLMNLKLEYNSYGGMDKYISQFEELCDKLEESKQGLTEEQKKTIFTINIKDNEYDALKDQCETSDFATTVLLMRKKAIKLGKASNTKRHHRNTNNTKTNHYEKHNYNTKKLHINKNTYKHEKHTTNYQAGERFDKNVWDQMSPENKKYIISLQKKNKKNKYGSQYNTQESKRNMNNIKTGKDSNTNNESSDDEKSTGDNKQSFDLGTMFTATRKANNKIVKKSNKTRS